MNVRLTYSGEQLFIALMQPPDLPTFEQSCIESRMETQDGTLDISSSSDCVDADHESQNEGSCLGHVNKISCFSSFCLQKFGEGGGYLLFIFRGQGSYATIFTGVKLGYKRRVKGKTGTTQVKKE